MIEFIRFILVYPITSPIIGLADMLRYNKNEKNESHQFLQKNVSF